MAKTIADWLKQAFKSDLHLRAALMKLLSRRPYHYILQEAVKKVPDITCKIETVTVRKIEAHWNTDVGLAIRLRCELSERKYPYLIHALSDVYCEEEDNYKRHQISPGVSMPALPSKNSTITKMKELFHEAQPETSEDAQRVTVSFSHALTEELARHPITGPNMHVQID
eukprot:gene25956-31776_t